MNSGTALSEPVLTRRQDDPNPFGTIPSGCTSQCQAIQSEYSSCFSSSTSTVSTTCFCIRSNIVDAATCAQCTVNVGASTVDEAQHVVDEITGVCISADFPFTSPPILPAQDGDGPGSSDTSSATSSATDTSGPTSSGSVSAPSTTSSSSASKSSSSSSPASSATTSKSSAMSIICSSKYSALASILVLALGIFGM
ncbi:hypothetical protein SISSUDRAFT_1061930 [Sistotremastrum suecicum HHB10207 ss-3]|uniref:Uncharacterized protein n=1 Tax=Sistotremastrum suecicum HHB10207 ss-3 TaxID=1314776 RepID=A0A166DFC6_9AGAM|nr:hypothetical protein SISSUDRAFT_1061930 [Sistotremastrum suecicum HHB10207 ss-3]